MSSALEQRCWNHGGREAVCRCPECNRSYCRECVSEHDSRLLCAECLARTVRTPEGPPSRLRRMAPVAMVLAGLLMAWVVLFGAGESLVILAERAEQNSWQSR